MNDFFDRLLSAADTGALAFDEVLLSLLVAFALAQVVAWLYVWTHRGLSYTASISQSIIVLSLVVALLMILIGNSLARAFGLFGALALIRFRTPIKDSRDTVFLFFAVAVGIAAGTQNIIAACVGTAVIAGVVVYLDFVRFGERFHHDGLVRFRCESGGEGNQLVQSALRKLCEEYSLLHVRDAGESLVEFAYQIRLYDRRMGPDVVSAIHGIEGISDLSLLMQDEETQP